MMMRLKPMKPHRLAPYDGAKKQTPGKKVGDVPKKYFFSRSLKKNVTLLPIAGRNRVAAGGRARKGPKTAIAGRVCVRR